MDFVEVNLLGGVFPENSLIKQSWILADVAGWKREFATERMLVQDIWETKYAVSFIIGKRGKPGSFPYVDYQLWFSIVNFSAQMMM